MKVCFIASIFPPDIGGPATYVYNVVSEFRKRGWEVEVVIKRGGNVLWRLLRTTLAIIKRGRRFDIFYANGGISASVPALIVAGILNKKVGVKITGDYAWEQARNRNWIEDDIDDFQNKKYSWEIMLLKKIQSWVVKRADFVIVPSQYLKNMVEGWGADGTKVEVVYNACPPFSINRSPTDKKIIFSAGRFVSWKGFDILISVFTDLRAEFPDTRLVIAGDGPMKNQLEALVKRNSLENNVLLTGSLTKPEMMKWFATADCFVLFSGYEGLSHVLLEAMSAGLPVIVSKKGGNTELVSDGVNGLLVPWKDEWALKAALRSFLERGKESISRPGLINSNNFSWQTMIEATIAVLKKAMANKNNFFVMRHVQSDHNVGGWISADEKTDSNSKLTPLGIEQAERLGQQLKDMDINVIYRSPFSRVADTCEIINSYLNVPIITDERLKQFDCGIFNGKTWKERELFFKNDLEKLTKRPPGGENFLDLKKRMYAAFLDINSKHRGSNILIVSHGNPLRMLQVAVLNLPDGAIFTDARALKWKSDITPEPEVGKLLLNE